MNLFVPSIGTQLQLAAPWTFTVHLEHRNNKFVEALVDAKLFTVPKNMVSQHGYFMTGPAGKCTLPLGTILKVDRIYIKKGCKDYDSMTFYCRFEDATGKTWKGRFWVKLTDANTIECALI
jgi:hypothetical protein